MPNSFEGKTRHAIAKEMAELVSKDETEAQFKALQALDPETRDFVIDRLEKDFLILADQFRGMIEEVGPAPAKKQFTGIRYPDTAAAVDGEQSLMALVQQLVQLKGEAADPLLKTFAQELSHLSKEQTETENAIYGALFDAVEKSMQADGSLAKLEETLRLVKIQEAFGWRVTVGVKEHFNKAGKIQEFATAGTDAEKNEQQAALKGLLWKSEPEAALSSLTATDVFMRVARRVGSDEELAALLPAGKFEANDVALLEKNKLTSLAALVKTALANKPK